MGFKNKSVAGVSTNEIKASIEETLPELSELINTRQFAVSPQEAEELAMWTPFGVAMKPCIQRRITIPLLFSH